MLGHTLINFLLLSSSKTTCVTRIFLSATRRRHTHYTCCFRPN